jgi:hypothetical protein
MMALHTGNAVLHQKIDAITGAAAIADHVAETHAFVDTVICHVFQHGTKSMGIAMDVTEDRH